MNEALDRSLVMFEQARGAVSVRLAVDVETAGHILESVARREGVSTLDLARDVLASCWDKETALPRDLYTNGHEYGTAA